MDNVIPNGWSRLNLDTVKPGDTISPTQTVLAVKRRGSILFFPVTLNVGTEWKVINVNVTPTTVNIEVQGVRGAQRFINSSKEYLNKVFLVQVTP